MSMDIIVINNNYYSNNIYKTITAITAIIPRNKKKSEMKLETD